MPQLVFLLQDVTDPVNVGSLFRTADALGAELILAGTTPVPPNPDINITSRGLERSVSFYQEEDALAAISKLKDDGFQIVGLDLTSDSQNYFQANYAKKVCLILGNEAIGIYKKVLAECELIVHIPMLGRGPSLNVNVAGAIVAAHILFSDDIIP